MGHGRRIKFPVRALAAASLLLLLSGPSFSDVVINVLAVNGSGKPIQKDIEFSLPGEITPEDIVDSAGLQIDYNVNDAGYFLHGNVSLNPKESKSLKVKVRDVWAISDTKANEIRAAIEQGFKEMGAERSAENGEFLRQRLLNKLEYVLAEQNQSFESIEARIDTYRNHVATVDDILDKTTSIDFWRTDAAEPENNKVIYYKVQVENPTDKPIKVKQQHYLPREVKPEYIVDRKGYEVRFNEKKGQPFLFKEEDIAPKQKKTVSFGIHDEWFVPKTDLKYIRERATYIENGLKKSKFGETAHTLFVDAINQLDMIEMLQAAEQPDIQQHIGAYRINEERYKKAKTNLDDLEKLLSRHRADLEKSKIKNVMQRIASLKSLSRVSQAIFDKKPTVNAAWKIIGSVMIFLAIFTVIHFVTWFLRSSKERKQEIMNAALTEENKINEA